MPIENILALLIAERNRLDAAIKALQSPVRRAARPAGNPVAGAPPARKRRFSAAQRSKIAARMKAYWAAKKKQAGAKK
jgi:hypothetical protein